MTWSLIVSFNIVKSVYCMCSAKVFSLHCCTLAAVQCETGGVRPPLCPPGSWQGLNVGADGAKRPPLALHLQLLYTKAIDVLSPWNPGEQRVFGLDIPEYVVGQIVFFFFFLLLFMSDPLKRPFCTSPSSCNESLGKLHVSLWRQCSGAAHDNSDSQLVHCEKFNKRTSFFLFHYRESRDFLLLTTRWRHWAFSEGQELHESHVGGEAGGQDGVCWLCWHYKYVWIDMMSLAGGLEPLSQRCRGG